MMNTPKVSVDGSKPFITYRAYRKQYLNTHEGSSIRRRRILYYGGFFDILTLLLIGMVWNINQQDIFVTWTAPLLFLLTIAGLTVFHTNHRHWLNKEENRQLMEAYDSQLKTWVENRYGFILHPQEVKSLRCGWQTEHRDGLALKPVLEGDSLLTLKVIGDTAEEPVFPLSKTSKFRRKMS